MKATYVILFCLLTAWMFGQNAVGFSHEKPVMQEYTSLYGPLKDTTQGIVFMVRNFDNPVLEVVPVIRIGENINTTIGGSLGDTYFKGDQYWHIGAYKQIQYTTSLDGKRKVKMFTPVPSYWVLKFYPKE
jgi:hypothetical protein